MKTAALLILAVVKALPKAESLVRHFIELYAAWKRTQNAHETKRKDARDDAIIDGLAAERVSLCGSCPYSGLRRGLDAGADAASGVSSGGTGRS